MPEPGWTSLYARLLKVGGVQPTRLNGAYGYTGVEVAMLEPVDVVIIGAGASGGAVARSLAETRMNILCLEQGDWVKPTDYPSNFRDSEALQMGAFSPSPNRRAGIADYPINEETRRSKSSISMASVVARSSMPVTTRAFIRRTFACARWTAWLTTGRSITARCNPGMQRTTG